VPQAVGGDGRGGTQQQLRKVIPRTNVLEHDTGTVGDGEQPRCPLPTRHFQARRLAHRRLSLDPPSK